MTNKRVSAKTAIMTDRKAIEARIHLFMTNIRKGLSYDANVVLLTNDIEQAIKGETKEETTIYLLNFALDVLRSNDLENARDKNNWVIGRDIEAHLEELNQQIENKSLI